VPWKIKLFLFFVPNERKEGVSRKKRRLEMFKKSLGEEVRGWCGDGGEAVVVGDER